MNINWLMGFIEAKGHFNISNQRIMIIKKKYTFDFIDRLEKNDLIRYIIQFSENGAIFLKKGPKSPIEILKDTITVISFTPEKLSEINIDNLRELFKLITALYRPAANEYRNFPRPSFTLTFNEDDSIIVFQIKKYIQKQGIKIYGPYKINKGRNLRIEIKGFENCIKFYDFLANQNWYTSKREKFKKWGEKILEIYENKEKNL